VCLDLRKRERRVTLVENVAEMSLWDPRLRVQAVQLVLETETGFRQYARAWSRLDQSSRYPL